MFMCDQLIGTDLGKPEKLSFIIGNNFRYVFNVQTPQESSPIKSLFDHQLIEFSSVARNKTKISKNNISRRGADDATKRRKK
ncbi:CLUMA_CG008917, isoform A [Clunio marinus]|uniref:CLUMA_CG008917, isoform A n=1 Tax=Clunio marinus TaxID=568069 RepID=A0A1J1I590_9DIPT|nr:CLUMA_CG008917, isoform A [Clunio marinus]